MKLGVIGLNPDNGHPFSFSAILNGYSDQGFAKSDWAVIHKYLRAKDPSDFGIEGVRVTHAWTQDRAATEILCEAARIEHIVDRPEDFIGKVDAVLLARHDDERHLEFAMPLLKHGMPLCIDKPLSLDLDELRQFRPYLENGKLMSCSALLYARELDDVRASLGDYGHVPLIRGAVVLGWEKYGVHLLDAVLGLGISKPVSVISNFCGHDSYAIRMADGSLLQIDALGLVAKTFRLDIFGTNRHSTHELNDNFAAFRRMLGSFVRMVETGRPQLPPEVTMTSMKVLIAGLRARNTGTAISLDSVDI